MNKYINIKKASLFIGVDITTLRRWDTNKKLVPVRTPGGHRRYTEKQLIEFMEKDDKQSI
jgi:DNA-binding transcriptional MerR regulator